MFVVWFLMNNKYYSKNSLINIWLRKINQQGQMSILGAGKKGTNGYLSALLIYAYSSND